MPDHPNLLVDTAWWSPGDMMAMFKLIPSGQIVWASDSPYGRPVNSAVTHLRFATPGRRGIDALRSIAGGQIARVLDGAELEHHPRPVGEAKPISPHLERVVDHLVAAVGHVIAGADPAEPVSLARLACDVGGEDPERPLLTGSSLARPLRRAGVRRNRRRSGSRRPATLLTAALSIARTPVPRPCPPDRGHPGLSRGRCGSPRWPRSRRSSHARRRSRGSRRSCPRRATRCTSSRMKSR